MYKTKKISIAIADDHPIVINGMRSVLAKQLAFDLVGEANCCESILTMLSQSRADILLLDLNMHGKDVTMMIRKLQRKFPRLRIIAYTSYDDPDLVKSVLDLGVQGYLLKNTHKEELFKAIERVMLGERYIGRNVKVTKTYPLSERKSDLTFDDNFQKKLRLSKREQEILSLISRGLTSQNIGKTLFISKHTVETHRKNILRKLNVNSSAELVKFAVLQGLA